MTPAVAVIDSARLRRRTIAEVAASRGLSVVGTAGDTAEAVALIQRANPDVITLDARIGIPPSSGAIDARRHRLIVIADDQPAEDEAAAEWLVLGAIDVVAKPVSVQELSSFVRRLHLALSAATSQPGPPAPNGAALVPAIDPGLVVVAAAEGGPHAVAEFLSALPRESPAVLVIQRLGRPTTPALVRALDRVAPFPVVPATDGAAIRDGQALVSVGDHHLGFHRGRVLVLADPPIGALRPAADVALRDLARQRGRDVAAVVLSGLDADGVEGSRAIVAAGGIVLTQSPDSALAPAMPAAVVAAGLSSYSGSPHRLADILGRPIAQGVA